MKAKQPLKMRQSLASINERISKLYQEYEFDCSMSDQVKLFSPHRDSVFRSGIKSTEEGKILEIEQLMQAQNLLNEQGEFITESLENAFFDILVLEKIVEVRGRNKLTSEQNEQINLICNESKIKNSSLGFHTSPLSTVLSATTTPSTPTVTSTSTLTATTNGEPTAAKPF